MTGGRYLEVRQGDVRVIQVYRRDFSRIRYQIAKDVAAARGDGDDVIVGADIQRLHIDDGIFPDLGVNQTPKQVGEKPFAQPLARQKRVSVNGFVQTGNGRAFRACGGK